MIRYIISSPIYPISYVKKGLVLVGKALFALVIYGDRFFLLLQSNTHQKSYSLCQPIPKNKDKCLYKTLKGVDCHDLKMFNNCGSSGGVSWENLLQLKI